MKLFIDDIRNAPDESWVVARTVTEAIRAIALQMPDTISLDHDISHYVSVGTEGRPLPCAETFQPVAYFIGVLYKQSSKTWNPTIILHTANPVGMAEMKMILNQAGVHCECQIGKPANRLEMEV